MNHTTQSWSGFEPYDNGRFRLELPGRFFVHVTTRFNVGGTYSATLKFPAGDRSRSKAGFRKLRSVRQWAEKERRAYLRSIGVTP